MLSEVGEGRDDVRKLFVSLLNDRYLHVRVAAVRALGKVGDERCALALKKLTTGLLDGRLKRTAEEVVEKLTKGIEEEKS